MNKKNKIGVVIPALNEESSIAAVIGDIPPIVDVIVVVDNGSHDRTSELAEQAGAVVLHEPKRGYGYACTRGIHHLQSMGIEVVIFLDGDYSDHPEELPDLLTPIIEENFDLVIGSRMIGKRDKGALLPQALFGNWLAGFLINLIWGYKFTDLGPFRAIKMEKLLAMNMVEFTFGWTIEMQIKAAKMMLRTKEIPVSYRKRIGKSKVTGTLSGTVKASIGILSCLFRHASKKKL
ncbi:glycosyltransferase family 2 protein [candidate division CSSED10-310 bacterium]|uniref:Glycosyltransferase family 2 protein n=1 Tax=candidate division CSSED10-310 bacterium TaxID=2855610 RepID=A0ABV6YYL5_UNCC1